MDKWLRISSCLQREFEVRFVKVFSNLGDSAVFELGRGGFAAERVSFDIIRNSTLPSPSFNGYWSSE